MSRKENLISELHPRKGTWKIAVCIIDMWDVKKHNVRQAIDMVLIDQTEVERPEIHANVHVITEIADIISGIAPRHTLVDKYPLSVQNIKNGSKLYVNSNDIAEIRKFRDSLCVPYYVGGVTKKGSGSQSQYTSNSQRSDRDKFLHNAQMVSLGDISRLREGGDEIKVFPECVDDLVGKTLALRFKYRVNMR
ncbi:hypothetical protein JHK87_022649 [Glycine soja]|nr:hypothetical protein JHK87_022649 [Glycine soja]